MPAEVKKIRDFPSTPELTIGMLQGHAHKIKHIAAVVVWDDDTYQMVNDPMPLSTHAFAIAVMQKKLMDEIA